MPTTLRTSVLVHEYVPHKPCSHAPLQGIEIQRGNKKFRGEGYSFGSLLIELQALLRLLFRQLYEGFCELYHSLFRFHEIMRVFPSYLTNNTGYATLITALIKAKHFRF